MAEESKHEVTVYFARTPSASLPCFTSSTSVGAQRAQGSAAVRHRSSRNLLMIFHCLFLQCTVWIDNFAGVYLCFLLWTCSSIVVYLVRTRHIFVCLSAVCFSQAQLLFSVLHVVLLCLFLSFISHNQQLVQITQLVPEMSNRASCFIAGFYKDTMSLHHFELRKRNSYPVFLLKWVHLVLNWLYS